MTQHIHKFSKNSLFFRALRCFFLLIQLVCISMGGEKEDKSKSQISASSSTSSFSSTQESSSTSFSVSFSTSSTIQGSSATSSENSTASLIPSSKGRVFRRSYSKKKEEKHKVKKEEKSSQASSAPAILPMIYSEMSPAINSNIASIIQHKVEALTSNEMERRYLTTVAYLIQNSASHYDTAKIVIYSYPLFTSEGYLFTLLTEFKETHSQQIIAFLSQLVLEGFPNRIEHLQAALKEFYALKNRLLLPPLLSEPFFVKFFAEPSGSTSLSSVGDTNSIKLKDISLTNCDGEIVKQFAKALAYENIRLLSAIKLEDMKSYLEDENHPPESITAFIKHRSQIINWIAWKIVTQEDGEARSRLMRNFTFIAHFQTHNLCSATMIAMALQKTAVMNLFSQQEKYNKHLKKLFELISPLKNNLNYRTLWTEFQKEGDCVPAFHILYQDAVIAFGTYKSIPPDDHQGLANVLAGIAAIIEPLSRCRTLSCSHSKDNFKVIWEFDEVDKVDDDILDKISSLRQEKILQEQSQLPKKLENWTEEHFFSFLKQQNICEKKINKILKSGVRDGSTIITYIGPPPQQLQRKKLEKLGLDEGTINTIFSAIFGNL
jgi:hypothetical protein